MRQIIYKLLIGLIILNQSLDASKPDSVEKFLSVGWFVLDREHLLPIVKSDLSVNIVYSCRKDWDNEKGFYNRYIYAYLGIIHRTNSIGEKDGYSWYGANTIVYDRNKKLFGISVPMMSHADMYIYSKDPFISRDIELFRGNIGGGVFYPIEWKQTFKCKEPIAVRAEAFLSFVPFSVFNLLSLERYPIVFMLQPRLEIKYRAIALMFDSLVQYQLIIGKKNYTYIQPFQILLGIDLCYN